MYPVRHQTWLPSIFSDLFDDNFPVVPAKQFASPAVNIKESDKDFKIEIAAPGMNDEELVIDLEKKACKEPKEEKKENYLRREFTYASYHQSFTLPDNINLDAISAEMLNGVLNITLPKKEEKTQIPATRQIEIK